MRFNLERIFEGKIHPMGPTIHNVYKRIEAQPSINYVTRLHFGHYENQTCHQTKAQEFCAIFYISEVAFQL